MTDTPGSRYTLPFWEALSEGRFLVHRCRECSEAFFPPAPVCPNCGDRDVEWYEASGRGRLHSFTRQHTAPPGFEAPRVVGLVELEAGPRLLAPIGADYDSLSIGAAVEVVPTEYDADYDRGPLAEFPFFEALPVPESGSDSGSAETQGRDGSAP